MASAPARAASDAEVAAELMQPGPLPDIVEGRRRRPSTIIEYASMTCSHCAAFQQQVWPMLKAKYVDTGKARFILREFPLDPLAVVAFMAARCLGPDKRDGLIDKLFATQSEWAFGAEPIERLREAAGLSPGDFLACVKDKTLFDGVTAIHDSAAAAIRRQFDADLLRQRPPIERRPGARRNSTKSLSRRRNRAVSHRFLRGGT